MRSPEGFRADIQGIRAVAVLTVVLYHAGVPGLRGGYVGVDVFFVISGYLITGGLVGELRRTGRVSLADFYIRRMARILPAAMLAIAGTAVLSRLLLPVTRWQEIGKDAVASSAYVVNWVFARTSVDYVALDQAPSPLQHMWSLSVEEQFYIVWPVLLVAVAAVMRHAPDRRHLLAAVALVALPSFVWSVYYTTRSPSAAYFVTTTRMWELAIGAGLAVVGPGRPVPRRWSGVVGWAGLAAILASAVTYTASTPFPGHHALLPTLGTAALIWSGSSAPLGAGRLLSLRPLVFVGAISYSLYLWHWPLLVVIRGREGHLSATEGSLIVAIAGVLAWLSTRYVEKPAQRFVREFGGPTGHRGVRLAVGLAFSALGVLLAFGLVRAAPSSDAPDLNGPLGASTLAGTHGVTVVDRFDAVTPAVTRAARDLPAANTNGCMVDHRTTEAHVCSYGDLHSANVIALVGDSHAAMYIPGLSRAARDAGYRLDTYTKGSCPPVTLPVDFHGRDYVECREWTGEVFRHLLANHPRLVITAMSREYQIHGSGLDAQGSRSPMGANLAAGWRMLLADGIRVAGIRDVPRLGMVVPDCVAEHLTRLSACARSQDDVLPTDDQVTLAARAEPRASVLDFTSALCGRGTCPAVIGRVIVYRDSNHLTATYARTMRDQIRKQLLPLLR